MSSEKPFLMPPPPAEFWLRSLLRGLIPTLRLIMLCCSYLLNCLSLSLVSLWGARTGFMSVGLSPMPGAYLRTLGEFAGWRDTLQCCISNTSFLMSNCCPFIFCLVVLYCQLFNLLYKQIALMCFDGKIFVLISHWHLYLRVYSECWMYHLSWLK